MCNDKPMFLVPQGISEEHIDYFCQKKTKKEQEKRIWHYKQVESLDWDFTNHKLIEKK